MELKFNDEPKLFEVTKEEVYTQDTFKCGICKQEKGTIDSYVSHMLDEEKCILVMEESSCLKDLLLPKFKRNNSIQKFEEIGKHLELNSLKAIEIEVGQGVKRWKCKMCSLTFSRQAAVLNHFKLAEHRLPDEFANKEIQITKVVKKECKPACAEVSNTFADEKNDLRMNVVKTPISQPICHICGQIFKSESIVASHIKIVHSERRPFVCDMEKCSLTFKTKGSLVRHMRRHTGDRPYKCELCGRSYRESGSLLRHRQSKVPCNKKRDSHLPRYGITLPFACGLKTDSEGENKIDLKKERGEEEEGTPVLSSQVEEDVGEAEETKAKIRKEILKRNQDLPQLPMSLGTLDKKPILNLKDLKKELSSYDSDDQKETNESEAPRIFEESEGILRRCFLCPVCYKTYSNLAFLSNHIKKHLVELGSECGSCKKRFTSDHALARHLLTHSVARQFECRQCGKAFKLKSHALSHLKSHSSTKTVPCPECGALFKSVSSRNNHLKIHKGEKDYECSVCLKKFLVKASFLRHLRVHTQEKPFQCPHCKHRFKEQGSLKRHIRYKVPCSQFQTSSTTPSGENVDSKIKEDIEGRMENLGEINDTFSEADSELESYLSEKFDISSIYSEHSDLAFSPDEYLMPRFDHIEALPILKQEVLKRD